MRGLVSWGSCVNMVGYGVLTAMEGIVGVDDNREVVGKKKIDKYEKPDSIYIIRLGKH